VDGKKVTHRESVVKEVKMNRNEVEKQ